MSEEQQSLEPAPPAAGTGATGQLRPFDAAAVPAAAPEMPASAPSANSANPSWQPASPSTDSATPSGCAVPLPPLNAVPAAAPDMPVLGDSGTTSPRLASAETEAVPLFELPVPLPRFDAAELLARQLAEIEAPVELTEAEIAALPLSSDEPPDLAETPWWLTDEFHGSDAAEHAAWLAGLPADIRAAYENGPWDGSGEVFAAGFLHHDPGGDGPAGPGFIAGGWADTALPGPALATAAADAGTRRGDLGESELIGLLCGWQRLTAWAQAGQAACLNTLVWRRKDQSVELNRPDLAAHVDDEAAAALALTGRAASRLLDVCTGLARLPEVDANLAAGRIDWAKASLFTDLLAGLPDEAANDIASLVLAAGDVTRKTTGQLRAALARAILAYDPEAAQRRREEARKDASVQAWTEPSGNAALAGRELSSADVIHADAQLTADARWLAKCGLPGSIDQLRALAFAARLTDRPLSSLVPAPASDTHANDSPANDSASANHGDSSGPDSPHVNTGGSPDVDATTGNSAADDTARANDGHGTSLDLDGGESPDLAGSESPDRGDGSSTDRGPDRGDVSAATGHSGSPNQDGGASPDLAGSESPDHGDGSSTDRGPDLGGVSAAAGHGHSASPHASGSGSPDGGPLGGTINLTMPLAAWAGLSDTPGELAGYGPADAATCRDLAARTGPATRWCLTLTNSDGRAVAHACASHPPGRPGPGNIDAGDAGPGNAGLSSPGDPDLLIRWVTGLACKIQFLESGPCTHARQSPGYRPPPSLAHLLRIRQRTCSYPGCRRPARRCDLDHVVPYDRGGATCECNLTPLCRRHHQAKQAPRWHLTQNQPGSLTWELPHGRRYTVTAEPYPV